MSARGFTVLVVVLAASRAFASPLWDGIGRTDRRQCARLIDEAVRQRDAGEVAAAAQTLRAAAELCPNDRELLQSTGEALLAARHFADGRVVLERARVLDDGTATHERQAMLAFLLGFAREVTGDLDGAIDEHRRLESLGGLPAPNQYLVHYNLGDELMATGRLAEAIDEYRRAVLLAPERPVPRLALAVALDRDEQVDKARAELAIVLTFDRKLQRLDSEDYIFVPAADVHYYRALALAERGAAAEGRVELRVFLSELPDGPYSAHARRRLVEAERVVDPRELEVSSAAVDKRILAHALAPVLSRLEDCLPAPRLARIHLSLIAGSLRADSAHPAAECLNHVLSEVDTMSERRLQGASVTVPLAGRRTAAANP